MIATTAAITARQLLEAPFASANQHLSQVSKAAPASPARPSKTAFALIAPMDFSSPLTETKLAQTATRAL
jgi:hypothetical protein